MSRDYTKVAPAIWKSKKFRDLTDTEAKLFYFFVLTGPHQTNAGISKLPLPYAAYDLGVELEAVEQSMEACIAAGLLDQDPETDEVLITNWFTFNIPMNRKHRIGVVHTLERVESDRLLELAMYELEKVYCDPDAEGPNKPPEQTDESIDEKTGEIIEFNNNSGKAPHEMSRADMDQMIARRRAGS